MTPHRAPDALASRVKKLAQIAAELRRGKSFNITRLTAVKKLCEEPAAAARFALYLAERTCSRMLEEALPSHLAQERWESFKALVSTGVEAMRRYLDEPTPAALSALRAAYIALKASQSEHERQAWGPVRIVESREAVLVEDAIACLLMPQQSADWGYRLAREHAERYDPRYGTGLIPQSAPAVEEIAAFWSEVLQAREVRSRSNTTGQET
jgi:hypothetical protein